MAEVTLTTALENIQSGKVSDRAKGLNDLRHILRYNRNTSRLGNLDDRSFHTIFDTLFTVAIDAQPAFVRAKTSTTRSTAAARLSDIASGLRHAVEAGVRVLKFKTASAVLHHVVDTIFLPNKALCEPLALDYARTMRAILEYQPHVEHMNKPYERSLTEWGHFAQFCSDLLDTAEQEASRGNGTADDEHSSTAGAANGRSHPSSFSTPRDSAGSQNRRSASRAVAEEVITCLRLLTAVPNAPLKQHARELVRSIIGALRASVVSGVAHADAFGAINNLLSWMRTEDTAGVQEMLSQLVRLVKQYWSSKANSQMLVTLWLLRPYISHLMRHTQAVALRPELTSVLHVLETEYSNRHEMKHLTINDLRLQVNPGNIAKGDVSTSLFALRCNGIRSEANWLLVHILAFLHGTLALGSDRDTETSHGKDAENGDEDDRPKKRQRIEHPLHSFFRMGANGTALARICNLQTTTFLTQQRPLAPQTLQNLLDSLAISCGEENANVCSWAFLAVASCAAQRSAQDPKLAGSWPPLWQLACRALSNSNSCRAAAYALHQMLSSQLVSHSQITELVTMFNHSMELNGPSHMSDAVSLLLRGVMDASQQASPVSASATATSITNWLLKVFRPSKTYDRQYSLASSAFDAADVIPLIGMTLSLPAVQLPATGLLCWDHVARAWLFCADEEPLIAYLLLHTDEDMAVHAHASKVSGVAPVRMEPTARLSAEKSILNHFNTELGQMVEYLDLVIRGGAGSPSTDAVALICKACVVFAHFAFDVQCKDGRLHLQFQQQTRQLLKLVGDFLTLPSCDQGNLDICVATFSAAFTYLPGRNLGPEHNYTECERALCNCIRVGLVDRHAKGPSGDDLDPMELDGLSESQHSRGGSSQLMLSTVSNDLDATYGKSMLLSSAALYATALNCAKTSHESSTPVPTAVTDYLLSQTEDDLLSCRDIITSLPRFGIVFSAEDAQRMMEYFMEDLLRRYAYSFSEVALGTVLDILDGFIELCTDPTNETLYDLGLDMYEWFAANALEDSFFSPNVQKRLAKLLLHLCHADSDYGKTTKYGTARTVCFSLIKKLPIAVQYWLAGCLPTLFSKHVLSVHGSLFADLQESLPDDIDWIEGMTMRLLFISRLACAWRSVLRDCIWYLFDAGRLSDLTPHAAHCVGLVASNLPLKKPEKMFTIFAPQLLFSWLDAGKGLDEIPFGVFHYPTLQEMLRINRSEVLAQLTMRGDEKGMEVMSKTLRMMPKDAVRTAYAKCVAYCMSSDVVTKHTGTLRNPSERRLWESIGGKADHESLIMEQYPVIMGYLFLSLQVNEPHDEWLKACPEYVPQFNLLSAMKDYSSSSRALPFGQDPSFKSTYFCDQIERLCRRVNTTPTSIWQPTVFSMVVRMLLDAIDDSLGSLQTCLMVRRLRVLIAMAGDVALDGFGLEVLIHSLRPVLADGECADDVLGILWYLFNKGRTHLRTRLNFTTGAVILLILQMRRHAQKQHETTTQPSQHVALVEKMLRFQKWLVNYIVHLAKDEEDKPSYPALGAALEGLRLPGNAKINSAESSLLLFLLDQWSSATPLCPRADTTEALRLLSDGFEIPAHTDDDCLGDDANATRYAQQLWEAVMETEFEDSFTTWAAGVLGRSYASTGFRPTSKASQMHDNSNAVLQSQEIIVKNICELLYSRDRVQAGIAEWTLRRIMENYADKSHEEEQVEISNLLTSEVFSAVCGGTFSYEAPAMIQRPKKSYTRKSIDQALEISRSDTIEAWAAELAITLCEANAGDRVLSPLVPLICDSNALAPRLLPAMIHILLHYDVQGHHTLHATLSKALGHAFSVTDPAAQPKQRFMLSILLYLKSRPYPGEATKADRVSWLDIDYLVAAGAASRCGMAACALMFAEYAPRVKQDNRRASKRASLSQANTPAKIPDSLLVEIYAHMEEPDSFYGVEQPASLSTVLVRLDHESDGVRSLMFRSAQVDARMRQNHHLAESDAVGMVQSLTRLNFNSLALSLVTNGLGNLANCSSHISSAAQNLQQWDIALPGAQSENTLPFSVLQELSRASDHQQAMQCSNRAILDHMKRGIDTSKPAMHSLPWFGVLGALTEISELVSNKQESDLVARWEVFQHRAGWMRLARYEDVKTFLSTRQTSFAVLSQNTTLQQSMHLTSRRCLRLEGEALLANSKLSRQHSRLQEALTATACLDDMLHQTEAVNLHIKAAVQRETASVLWDAGEAAASVKMLQSVFDLPNLDSQDLPVGLADLRAQLGHQLADARLEKPEEILSRYLKPAIDDLKHCRDGKEAGRVYHEFATFCDKELQSPASMENLNRIIKLRQGKEEEIEATQQALANAKKTGGDRRELEVQLSRARTWLGMDKAEEQRLRKSRRDYAVSSLQYYLRALHVSDEHDICVLRFFALWLESSNEETVDATVQKYLPRAPSWKFVRLMNQLMSRVEDGATPFQFALAELMNRIFKQHPYHSLHHLFAASRAPRGSAADDATAQSRYRAAQAIQRDMAQEPAQKKFLERVFQADHRYKALADNAPEMNRGGNKVRLKDFPSAYQVASSIPKLRLPPITITLPLKPSADYSDAPYVVEFDGYCTVMGGLSAPKVLKARASDGKWYRELFKSGRDDLRQDAIMEQVFEEVSKMLSNHKATRQRDLKVRTYKVIPLAKTSGVIEFVPNSMPINDFLRPAHKKYYPKDLAENKARDMVDAAHKTGSLDTRLRRFREICDRLHPVLRHFFFERFNDPDEWFEKRTAYTRTTASVSILGHILGLGDRHCSNILIDEKTGEVVHIDLGVAFEAGRVLQIPEVIPFRLTRDIVDGMGATGTEGVFRRCCEFTMDAVREDKDSIMTLLNVLKYDPLYEWTMSPLRAKRMQEAQDINLQGGDIDEPSSKKTEQAAGEAERALAIVEKKLEKTLSTTATINELIQQATDEKNLAVLFMGWAAFF